MPTLSDFGKIVGDWPEGRPISEDPKYSDFCYNSGEDSETVWHIPTGRFVGITFIPVGGPVMMGEFEEWEFIVIHTADYEITIKDVVPDSEPVGYMSDRGAYNKFLHDLGLYGSNADDDMVILRETIDHWIDFGENKMDEDWDPNEDPRAVEAQDRAMEDCRCRLADKFLQELNA